MLRIVCWLWRDEGYRWNRLFRYGADHVNRWASMVRRHCSLPHELVCVTDSPDGIDPGVRIVPIWDDLRDMGRCYVRLKAFAPEMADIIGPRFVSMDLDCVVTGSLDPLFQRDEDFVIWASGMGPTPYCGSMFMMTAGARKEVLEEFDPATSPARGKALGYVGSDQAWISARLPDEATWTPADGVLSRYHVGIRHRGEKPSMRPGLPEGARVVFMHGPYDPSQPALQARHPWINQHWK